MLGLSWLFFSKTTPVINTHSSNVPSKWDFSLETTDDESAIRVRMENLPSLREASKEFNRDELTLAGISRGMKMSSVAPFLRGLSSDPSKVSVEEDSEHASLDLVIRQPSKAAIPDVVLRFTLPVRPMDSIHALRLHQSALFEQGSVNNEDHRAFVSVLNRLQRELADKDESEQRLIIRNQELCERNEINSQMRGSQMAMMKNEHPQTTVEYLPHLPDIQMPDSDDALSQVSQQSDQVQNADSQSDAASETSDNSSDSVETPVSLTSSDESRQPEVLVSQSQTDDERESNLSGDSYSTFKTWTDTDDESFFESP